MNENLVLKLIASAERHGPRPALKLGDTVVTYAELEAASAGVAEMLHARGLSPGDRVGIMLPNVPQFAIAYYGVLRAGGVVVPMNVLLKQREVAFYLGNSQARLVFAWHEFAGEAALGAGEAGAEVIVVNPGEFQDVPTDGAPPAAVVERAGDDTAVILYTSGTTGTPKGAELTHAGLARNVDVLLAGNMFGLEAQDVVFGALPLFHAFGQACSLNATISAGACLALLPRFDAAKALGLLDVRASNRVRRRPHDVHGAAQPPRPRADGRLGAAAVRVRRRRDARRGAARLRSRVRLQGPRGLRDVGDLTRDRLQPLRSRAQGRLGGHPDRGRRDPARRRRTQRGRPGRTPARSRSAATTS